MKGPIALFLLVPNHF